MKFTLLKASDYNFKKEVEINSLEELKSIQDYYYEVHPEEHTKENVYYSSVMEHPSLVVDFNAMTITVYDYYLE